MKRFFKRMAKQGAAVLLSAALVLGAGDFSAFRGMTAFAAETVCGAFTVTGGTSGTDYTYENNVLTIKTATALTISGTSTTDRIEVESGVNANITLSGVNIERNRRRGGIQNRRQQHWECHCHA